jgi:hypothetical protein
MPVKTTRLLLDFSLTISFQNKDPVKNAAMGAPIAKTEYPSPMAVRAR